MLDGVLGSQARSRQRIRLPSTVAGLSKSAIARQLNIGRTSVRRLLVEI